jgi:hypothetical protein
MIPEETGQAKTSFFEKAVREGRFPGPIEKAARDDFVSRTAAEEFLSWFLMVPFLFPAIVAHRFADRRFHREKRETTAVRT